MPATTPIAFTGDAYIDGIVGSDKWAVRDFTFSFPTSGSFYEGGYGRGEPNIFLALNSAQITAAREAFDQLSSVANVTFSEITESSTQHADLRLAQAGLNDNAWAYYPSTRPEGGDVWFASWEGDHSRPLKGNYGFMTVFHELGHALGLDHAHEGLLVPTQRDSMEYTVMSYSSYPGAPPQDGYTNEEWGFAQSLMMYDIAALQHLYGADYSTQSGNTVYSWSPTTGEMFINGIGQGIAGYGRIFLTVWDGGGTDTYDFSNYTTAVKVDLRPGEWTITSASQLAKLHDVGSKTAVGNIANALLHEGDTRSLIEHAIGGSSDDNIIGNVKDNTLAGGLGNDTLIGLGGSDTLDGGGGIDRAVFSGLNGAGHAIFSFGGVVHAIDRADRSFDTVKNFEQFADSNQTIGLAQIKTFDAFAYGASYNDLAIAIGGNADILVSHYLRYGFAEHREISFDAVQYTNNYGDLALAFGNGTNGAAQHFLNYGVDEHRLADNPFEYVASFDDLISAFANLSFEQTKSVALQHYQSNGFAEGRRDAIDFDVDQYLANYADLQGALGSDDDMAAFHFINFGREEHRLWEDPLEYVASNGDLIAAFGAGNEQDIRFAALNHFSDSGFKEGRREIGIDFDTDQYLTNYADLRAAFADGNGGYDQNAAMLHYVQHGFSEGRIDSLLLA